MSRLTRRQYAVETAAQVYRGDHELSSRDLLARLLERELSRNYDSNGNRKEKA